MNIRLSAGLKLKTCEWNTFSNLQQKLSIYKSGHELVHEHDLCVWQLWKDGISGYILMNSHDFRILSVTQVKQIA